MCVDTAIRFFQINPVDCVHWERECRAPEAGHEVGCCHRAAHDPVEQALVSARMEGALALRELAGLAAVLTATRGTPVLGCGAGSGYSIPPGGMSGRQRHSLQPWRC